MTKTQVREDQRVTHVRRGAGTVVSTSARHAGVVRVVFDIRTDEDRVSPEHGVWLADLEPLDEN